MVAVGIDISKASSTVAILNGDGSIRLKPFTVQHTVSGMSVLVKHLKDLEEPPIILMEYTGHYHCPVLKTLQAEGLEVCIVNPLLVKKFGEVEIRKAITDKKDATRIATYALEKHYTLKPYAASDQKYEDLKFLSRQYQQRISVLTSAKLQLHALLD